MEDIESARRQELEELIDTAFRGDEILIQHYAEAGSSDREYMLLCLLHEVRKTVDVLSNLDVCV